jgi:cytochrome-b5 reductase
MFATSLRRITRSRLSTNAQYVRQAQQQIRCMSSTAENASGSFATASLGGYTGRYLMGGLGLLSLVGIYNVSTASTVYAADGSDVVGLGELNDKEFHPFKLVRKEKYNHDSSVYHFALASPNDKLNLPVSSCIVAKIDGPEGKPIIRPYTPIDTEKLGELTLLVKSYPQGNLSRHIDGLKPNDTLLLKGPVRKLDYSPNMKKHIALVAGGSGITPCLQILEKLLGNPQDHTKVTLLFANRSPEDVLLKERFDSYKQQFKDRFNLIYFVDNGPKNWKGEVGYINKEKLKQYLPPPSNDVLVYVCGPPKMYETISGTKAPDYSQGEVGGVLKELGYTKEQVYKL